MTSPETPALNRREFLAAGARGVCLLGLGGLAGGLVARVSGDDQVWQIDPARCTWCGLCATECVLEQSAAKCLHAHAMCGYCKLCTGFFEPRATDLNTGAENQLCPTGAIKRAYVEDPYYEYRVDEPLCIGCARCVKGCNTFGNGSLFLQIRHDICVNCNECSIARECPADAIRRVPASEPYRLQGEEPET